MLFVCLFLPRIRTQLHTHVCLQEIARQALLAEEDTNLIFQYRSTLWPGASMSGADTLARRLSRRFLADICWFVGSDLEEKKRQKAAAELAALEEKMVFMHLAGEV